MKRILLAVGALAALAVAPAAGSAAATKAETPTARTCAWVEFTTCPARRTKLYQFWGKPLDVADNGRWVELDLEGFGHIGALRTALNDRLGDVVRVKLPAKLALTRIDYDGKRSKIDAATFAALVDDVPRATVYATARIGASSSWDDDMPVLNATRLVVDLSDLTPPPSLTQGLTAWYFANTGMAGVPFATEVDPTVDFDWADAGPGALAGRTDEFSVRWMGRLLTPNAGTYRFRVSSDDGVRMTIDGVLLVDRWNIHSLTTDEFAVDLTAGSHIIDLQYYEQGGQAVSRLAWQTPGATGFATVPASALRAG